MARGQQDIPLSDLEGPFGIVNVVDPEIAHGREPKIILNETITADPLRPTLLYAVDIDPNTGLLVGPAGASTTPVQDVDITGDMVEVGVQGVIENPNNNTRIPNFPNGAEWTNDSDHKKVVFYSAKKGEEITDAWRQIRILRTRFNDDTRSWEDPVHVRFDTVRDRYLFAANYSDPNHTDEALDDRIIFFAAAEPGRAWNDQGSPAEVRWAWVPPTRQRITDLAINTGSLLDNPFASPVRPIPSTYAAFVARSVDHGNGSRDLELWWVDLYPIHIGNTSSEKLIQRYSNVDPRVKLLGLGARRCAPQDTIGPFALGHAFLLYAYFSGPDPDLPAWCDVFWVYFNQATLGGSISSPSRAFAWDASDPVHASDAWRIIPSAHPIGPYMIDDENFEGNDGYPRAVFTFGSIGSAADAFDPTDPFFAQHTEIYVYSLWRSGGNPWSTHDPASTPMITTPTEELLVTGRVIGAGATVSRKDAEPLTLHPNDNLGPRETLIYYLAPPNRSDPHNKFRRADALV